MIARSTQNLGVVGDSLGNFRGILAYHQVLALAIVILGEPTSAVDILYKMTLT